MKVCMAKVSTDYLNAWIPSRDEDAKVLQGQTEIIFDLKKSRNAINHRRYFAFVGKAFKLQATYHDIEIFRKAIQIDAGHFDLVICSRTGKASYWPKSIEWSELPDDEFNELRGQVISAYLKRFGQNFDDNQIDELMRF